MLQEFRRIVLGEFMDDLDFGKEIANLFGLQTSEDTAADETVGEERLSQGRSVFSNLGISLILFTLIFLTLILLLVLAIKLKRKMALSDKTKERIVKIKEKIFYNPIIRYLLLNSLKLNFSAFIVYRSPAGGVLDILIGSVFMVAINAVPILFLIVLNINR